MAPILTFALSLVSWIILPISSLALNIELGILFILVVSSLSVYGIIIAGWASNSNYALLGALRSAAQMISYEVSIGLLFVPLVLFISSFTCVFIIFYFSTG
jgi:NADH-quinone oxidoreductase subunit H